MVSSMDDLGHSGAGMSSAMSAIVLRVFFQVQMASTFALRFEVHRRFVHEKLVACFARATRARAAGFALLACFACAFLPLMCDIICGSFVRSCSCGVAASSGVANA
jgi:hypothetical protein